MRKISQRVGFTAVALMLLLAGCATPTETKTTTVAGPSASGATTVYGTVSGRVVDALGAPLAGVVVSTNTGGNSRAIVQNITNGDGLFEIEGLISGDHTIMIGNGTSTTSYSYDVTVPDLAYLQNNAVFPAVYDANDQLVPNQSFVNSHDNYYMNISLGQYTVYPRNATLTGAARLKVTQNADNALATAAPAGTKVVAVFSGFNDFDDFSVQGTVTGATGAFTIPGVPALGDLNALLDSSGDISFYIVSDDPATGGFDSVPINGNLSNTAVTPTNLYNGALVANSSRALGELFFTAAVSAKIIDQSPNAYDSGHAFPGTISQNLVLTFDKAMDITKGTLSLYDDNSSATYRFTSAWSVGNTVLTITPLEQFIGDSIITVQFTGYYSTDDVPFTGSVPYFYVAPALGFVSLSDNATTPYSSNYGFPVASDLNLTFNKALSRVVSATLTEGTNVEDLTAATITGANLALNPAASLKFNTSYSLVVTVETDYVDDASVIQGKESTTETINFTTAKASTAVTAPALSLSPNDKESNDNRTTYENGETLVYVTSTNLGDADVSYEAYYKLSTSVAWTSTTYTINSTDALLHYGEIAIPALKSGETVNFRIRAKNLVTGAPSTYSNTLSVADTTAPSASGGTSTAGAFNNVSGTTAIYATVTVTLSGEPISSVGLVGSAAPVISALVTKTYNPAKTSWVLTFKIPVGTNLSGQALTLQIQDGAGNLLDQNAGTAGQQDLTLNLP